MYAAHPLWLPLGELLVERELLSQRQLELALAEQRRTGRRLGEVLVDYGFVSQEALAATLLQQVGLADVEEAVDTAEPEPEPALVVEPEPEPEPEAERTPVPMVVRFDDEDPAKRRWWSRGPNEQRIADLERVLHDFERRSNEIQANIAEIRQTLRALHDG